MTDALSYWPLALVWGSVLAVIALPENLLTMFESELPCW